MSTIKPKCYAPFYNVYLRSSSRETKVCCMSTQSHTLESNAMSEVFNNPLAQDIRATVLRGEYHSACSECAQREDQGLHSDRDMYDDWHREAEKHTDLNPLDTHMPYPIWADIRPSNLCNLKCRMCFPDNSTEIAREEAKMPHELRPNRNTDQELAVLSQRKHYELPKLNNIINLKLLGGEPTVQEEVFDILKNTEYHPNLLLQVTTNASSITQYKKILPLIKKFAMVKWNISIDGTGDVYEYVRTPSKWSRFKEAVDYLSTTEAGRLSTIISFNYCIQMWNYTNTPDVLKYCEDIEHSIHDRIVESNDGSIYTRPATKIKYGGVHMNTVSQPHLQIKLVNKSIKDDVLARARELGINKTNYTNLKRVSRTTIHDAELVAKFRKHTKILDKVRNTDFATIDPTLMTHLRTVTH